MQKDGRGSTAHCLLGWGVFIRRLHQRLDTGVFKLYRENTIFMLEVQRMARDLLKNEPKTKEFDVYVCGPLKSRQATVGQSKETLFLHVPRMCIT